MDDLDLDAIRARAIAAGGADARWPKMEDLTVTKSNDIYIIDGNGNSDNMVARITSMDPATTQALLDEIDRLKDEIADLGDSRFRAPRE